MKAGETWDVPGVAFASRTGSENSIGPGMLFVSLLHIFLGGIKVDMERGDIHQEFMRCLFEIRHCS